MKTSEERKRGLGPTEVYPDLKNQPNHSSEEARFEKSIKGRER